MKTKLMAFVALSVPVFVIAVAAQDGNYVFESLHGANSKLQADQVVPPATEAQTAGCQIKTAITGALKGDGSEFQQNLKMAEIALKRAAKNLSQIASAKKYTQSVNIKFVELISSVVNPRTIHDRDDVLESMSSLATDSAKIIDNILSNHNDTGMDLQNLIRNDSDMSQLLLLFYTF